jgi:hypothetical protein
VHVEDLLDDPLVGLERGVEEDQYRGACEDDGGGDGESPQALAVQGSVLQEIVENGHCQ